MATKIEQLAKKLQDYVGDHHFLGMYAVVHGDVEITLDGTIPVEVFERFIQEVYCSDDGTQGS